MLVSITFDKTSMIFFIYYYFFDIFSIELWENGQNLIKLYSLPLKAPTKVIVLLQLCHTQFLMLIGSHFVLKLVTMVTVPSKWVNASFTAISGHTQSALGSLILPSKWPQV